ncbi:MAG: VOC family protein [Planctomycetota bacterium]|nr:VOC family protein [Planctomycetota bacterium]
MRAQHGIDYIEFTVKNMEESKTFFREAIGWDFNDYGPEYAGIKGEDREQGGLCVGAPKTGGALVILYSNDLEASFERVKGAGAEIVKEIFSFPGGRRFQFKDPNGYEFGIWAEASSD